MIVELKPNPSHLGEETLPWGAITQCQPSADRTFFQNSDLSASAADEGDGGNVTIDADTVLGLNSDITATAFLGDGGNILIDADAVIGLPNEKPTRITLLLMLMLALSSVGTE